MESRIFAGICGDFSSTNPLWRNRGEVERFFACGMVERLWSGNEKLVEKSVENPTAIDGDFHSRWKRLCTALHRGFHSGRRRMQKSSCGSETFSPHGFSTGCGKRCGKPEIFCGEAVESQDFQRNPTFPQETPDRKIRQEKQEGKRKRIENRFPIRLLQLSAAGEVLESVLHLFARILLASFPRYFRKILGNPQRISSVFPFISRKI